MTRRPPRSVRTTVLTSIQSLTLPRFSIAAANPEGEFEMHEKLSNALSKKKISGRSGVRSQSTTMLNEYCPWRSFCSCSFRCFCCKTIVDFSPPSKTSLNQIFQLDTNIREELTERIMLHILSSYSALLTWIFKE